MCKGFQRKEQTVVVATDPKDAYNRVKLSCWWTYLCNMDSPEVLLERTVQFGNWSSAPQQHTMGLPQGSLLSLVHCNVCILRSTWPSRSEQNRLSKVLTLADDGFIYKTLRGQPNSMQQLDNIFQWCQWISHQSKQGTHTVVHSWQQSSRQSDDSSHVWWTYSQMDKCEIPWDSLQQNADPRTCENDTTEDRSAGKAC